MQKLNDPYDARANSVFKYSGSMLGSGYSSVFSKKIINFPIITKEVFNDRLLGAEYKPDKYKFFHIELKTKLNNRIAVGFAEVTFKHTY